MKSKYFKTSDGTEFYTETNAINHARTLEDKTVTPPGVAIEEIEVEGAETVTGKATTDEGADEGADEGVEGNAAAEPTKVNISKFNKAQLIEFAADNDLAIDPTATNAVILDAIEAQLTEKNQA
jgi:hypothetical protein